MLRTFLSKFHHVDVCVQNIHVTAYSPLGTPPSSAMFKDYQPDLVMNDPVVKDMAKKYNKNVGQVYCFHSLQLHALRTLKLSV